MKIKQTKPEYQTADGRTFPTEEAAIRHATLTDAESKFGAALRDYTKALVETQMTADGVPFKLDGWRDYWKIVTGWGNIPQLDRISFSYYAQVWLDGERDKLYLNYRESSRNDKLFRCRISDLYASKQKAEEALVLELRQYISDVEETIEEIEKRYGSGGRMSENHPFLVWVRG